VSRISIRKIIELRKSKGWSQDRLAREAELDKTTINRIESGETKNPHFSTRK